MKHLNLDISGYWVIRAGWNLIKSSKLFKFVKSIVLGYIYQLSKFDDLVSCGSKDIFKHARDKFGKSWDGWKYKNLNILKAEDNFSAK